MPKRKKKISHFRSVLLHEIGLLEHHMNYYTVRNSALRGLLKKVIKEFNNMLKKID